jgi:hypothetical protein
MAMPQHKPSQNLSSQPQGTTASNETVKLIRKLRWIGMEEEAKKLQRELSEREEATDDCVVATPRDTD